MPFFNHHMSYAELSSALTSVCEEGRLLYKNEIKCIESSLQDEFLKKMLILYPLSQKSRKLINDSWDRQRERGQRDNNQIDRNVHSVIYATAREQTANYLEKNYRGARYFNLIDRLALFVEECVRNSQINYELEIAEAERYAARLSLHKNGQLTSITPKQSLNEIHLSFSEYIEHLRVAHQAGATFGWSVLELILRRLDGLETEADKQEAALVLIRALDDSRTAYHDKSVTYIPGKTYTCPKGLEERLLDHHYLLVPTQVKAADNHLLGKAILRLTEPFVVIDQTHGARSCSEALYQLYLKVAGYRFESIENDYYSFLERVPISALKERYVSQAPNTAFAQSEASNKFDACIRLLPDCDCITIEKSYPSVIDFLKKRGVLTQVRKVKEVFLEPKKQLSRSVILNNMTTQGPFIDRAHLEMVLALHDQKASLDYMEKAARAGAVSDLSVALPSKKDITHMYYSLHFSKNNRQSFTNPFYHFNFNNELTQHFKKFFLNQIGCSQRVLIEWLKKNIGELTLHQCQRLAVLCAKAGYAEAIKVICESGSVQISYVEPEERRSLVAIAAEYGHHAVIKTLFLMGAPIDVQNDSWHTPLMVAARKGQTQAALELIALGADINQTNKSNFTALMLAAENNHTETTQALIKAGAKPSISSFTRHTALGLAAAAGHIEVVRALLSVSTTAELNKALIDATYARLGSAEIIKLIIAAGANPNDAGYANQTALMTAAEFSNIEAMRALIAAGADLNIQDEHDGDTALMCAVMSSARQAVSELIAAGADLNIKNFAGYTPLMRAADKFYLEISQDLINAGAQLSLQLMFHPRLVYRKMCRDMGLFFQRFCVSTPSLGEILFLGIQSGDLETVQLCIESGANLNRISDQVSALDVAVQSRNPMITRELVLSEKLAPWVIIKALTTCIMNKIYHAEMLPILLLRKDILTLFVSQQPIFSAVAWATAYECVEAVKAFISVGADPCKANSVYRSPLDIACSRGHQELIALLSEYDSSQHLNADNLLVFSGLEESPHSLTTAPALTRRFEK